MSDIKWIKLSTNMHDDEKMKLVDAMPERYYSLFMDKITYTSWQN
ncbi:hypothetical protein B0H39_000821 [Clostridium beijerinckii]|nr:hypothetical protein [Clostridium beijerinckii]